MRKLLVLLCLILPGAALAADNYSGELHRLGASDVSAFGVTSSSGSIKSFYCHCTGRWSTVPKLRVIALNTRESYAKRMCAVGPNRDGGDFEPISPRRRIPEGTHLGVRVVNSPSPGDGAARCSVTIRIR